MAIRSVVYQGCRSRAGWSSPPPWGWVAPGDTGSLVGRCARNAARLWDPSGRTEPAGASPHRLVPSRRHHRAGFHGNGEPRPPRLPLLCNGAGSRTLAPHGTRAPAHRSPMDAAAGPPAPAHPDPTGLALLGSTRQAPAAPWGAHAPSHGTTTAPIARSPSTPISGQRFSGRGHGPC